MSNELYQMRYWLMMQLAGVAVLFAAALVALISYKIGAMPTDIAWFKDGGMTLPVREAIVDNTSQMFVLWMSAVLAALHLITEYKDTVRRESLTEIDSESSYYVDSSISSDDMATDLARSMREPQMAVLERTTAGKARDSQLLISLAEVTRLKKALVVSQRETADAKKIQNQFLSNMSHELRTPMNGIIGMSELLNECNLPKKEKHFAMSINASAEELLSLINDLLDYSRMDAGEMKLEQARFDIGACVEEVCAALAKKAHTKGIELICYVDADLPKYVKGDAVRLSQVLSNLINNAIASTTTGEIVVRLSADKTDGTAHTFKCEVQDTGCGIAPELQATLYDTFQQVNKKMQRRHNGVGIGLAITSELVGLMEGELSFRSRLGEGTRFTFTAKFQSLGDGDLGSSDNTKFKDACVLIVDDNATNRSILFHQVTGWGLDAEVAESGAEALIVLKDAAANGKYFDMLILDFHMPEMSGIELAREIRNNPVIAESKIMMLTSAIVELGADEMHELGIDTYISKPARQSQLRECLRDLIPTAKSVDGTPAKPKVKAIEKVVAPVASATPSDLQDRRSWLEKAKEKPVIEKIVVVEGESDDGDEDDLDDAVGDAVLNVAAIDKIRKLQQPDKPDILTKVLNLYMDKTPNQLISLLDAVAASDIAKVKEIVHAMRSGSAYLGAEQFVMVCDELDTSGEEQLEELANKLVEQYGLLEGELQQFVKAA